MPKQPTTIQLDRETRDKIERARETLARGNEKPSRGSVMREAITLGLPLLTASDRRRAG